MTIVELGGIAKHFMTGPSGNSEFCFLSTSMNKALLLDVFRNTFQYASEVHSYNTRNATQKNLHKPHVRTNTGKQMISFKAIDLWKSIPQNLKDSNVYTFSKNIKNLPLSEQFVS